MKVPTIDILSLLTQHFEAVQDRSLGHAMAPFVSAFPRLSPSSPGMPLEPSSAVSAFGSSAGGIGVQQYLNIVNDIVRPEGGAPQLSTVR